MKKKYNKDLQDLSYIEKLHFNKARYKGKKTYLLPLTLSINLFSKNDGSFSTAMKYSAIAIGDNLCEERIASFIYTLPCVLYSQFSHLIL